MVGGPWRQSERSAAWLFLAALFGSGKTHMNYGVFTWAGLAFTGAMVLAVALWAARLRCPVPAKSVVVFWLAVELFTLRRYPDVNFGLQAVSATATVVVLALTALAVLAFGPLRMTAAKWSYRIVLLGGFAVLAGVVVELGAPDIDVYVYHTEAARRLLDGEGLNGPVPYYEPSNRFSANYPYMPFEAVLRAPFHALGDVRYASVAAMLAAYPLVAALVQRAKLGVEPDLVASAVLVAGMPLFILRGSFTEPLALPFVFGGVLLAHRRPMAAAVVLGLAASLKLWLLVLIPAVWAWNRRGGLVAAATVALTVAPFAVQDWVRLVQGTVLFHFGVPPRLDGIVLVRLVPWWPTMVGSVAWLAGCLWLAVQARGLQQALAAAIGSLLALFFLGQQGHPNYYWLVPALLVATVLAPLGKDSAVVDGVVPPSGASQGGRGQGTGGRRNETGC